MCGITQVTSLRESRPTWDKKMPKTKGILFIRAHGLQKLTGEFVGLDYNPIITVSVAALKRQITLGSRLSSHLNGKDYEDFIGLVRLAEQLQDIASEIASKTEDK